MIAKNLKDLRKALNLTQEDFASLFGVARGTISEYERGKCEPSSEALIRLKKKYNVNLSWLFTGDGQMFLTEESDDLPTWIKELRYDQVFEREIVPRYQKNSKRFLKQIQKIEEFEKELLSV